MARDRPAKSARTRTALPAALRCIPSSPSLARRAGCRLCAIGAIVLFDSARLRAGPAPGGNPQPRRFQITDHGSGHPPDLAPTPGTGTAGTRAPRAPNAAPGGRGDPTSEGRQGRTPARERRRGAPEQAGAPTPSKLRGEGRRGQARDGRESGTGVFPPQARPPERTGRGWGRRRIQCLIQTIRASVLRGDEQREYADRIRLELPQTTVRRLKRRHQG